MKITVVLKIFLVWLALLLAVGFLSTHLPVHGQSVCNVKNQLPYYRWDSFWYTSVSRSGYTFSEVKNSSIAFFPLYPMIIRETHWITGWSQDKLSLYLNIIFSFLAAWYLYRLARIDYPKKTSLAVVATFLFFPSTYFFLSGYPEALFVLLTILSFFFSRKKEWGKAGLAAGLLALTKPYGILIFPVLWVEYLWAHDWDVRACLKKTNWWPLLLPLVFFGGFMLFNYLEFQSPVAFLKAQHTWGRSLAHPSRALWAEAKEHLLSDNIFSGSNFPYLVYLASLVFSLGAFVLSWKRVRKSYLIFSVLLLLSALLTGTLTSWGRYTLLGVSILIGPAVFLSEKKYAFLAYLLVSGLSLLFLASLFVRCYPVE